VALDAVDHVDLQARGGRTAVADRHRLVPVVHGGDSHVGRSPPGAEITTRSSCGPEGVHDGVDGDPDLGGARGRQPPGVGVEVEGRGDESRGRGAVHLVELRRKPDVTYSSCPLDGRTSVTVAWRSTTGEAEVTQRSSVAGPAMVVAEVNGAVWKPTPFAAGTGVQSHPGTAAQALPVDGRLVAGRTPASSRALAVPSVGWDPAAVASEPCGPSFHTWVTPAGGHWAAERCRWTGDRPPRAAGTVVEQHLDPGGLLVKSLRAAVRVLSLVKRMAGSGAWLVVPARSW